MANDSTKKIEIDSDEIEFYSFSDVACDYDADEKPRLETAAARLDELFERSARDNTDAARAISAFTAAYETLYSMLNADEIPTFNARLAKFFRELNA